MRKSGILLHITSLDSPYGIGTLGKSSFDFIDFLKKSGLKYWQILPCGHTSYGDSPYQTFSAFALNPYLLDLDILISKGYLLKEDVVIFENKHNDKVDYGFLYETRYPLFKKAYNNFLENCKKDINLQNEYKKFVNDNYFWLDDYSLFMAIKSYFKGNPWYLWPDDYKKRDKNVIKEFKENNQEIIEFYYFIQFELFNEWQSLKEYATLKEIEIIGDIPIYVAYDSADIWSTPNNFLTDENLNLDVVSGVPPDYFSIDGQLWGNPIYNYEEMKKNNYSWWKMRIEKAFELYDYVRIDHFRGFASFYAIKATETTAKNGKWYKGPGYKLFEEIKNKKIIAEDLGLLTDDVYELLEKCQFPGMKILQFAFDPNNDNPYLPHNSINNSIYYTGTHDNMTLKEWVLSLTGDEKKYVYDYCYMNNYHYNNFEDELCDRLIRIALSTSSKIVIIPLTDYLKLDGKARMNVPSKKEGNWTYRLNTKLDDELSKYIYNLNKIYKRI